MALPIAIGSPTPPQFSDMDVDRDDGIERHEWTNWHPTQQSMLETIGPALDALEIPVEQIKCSFLSLGAHSQLYVVHGRRDPLEGERGVHLQHRQFVLRINIPMIPWYKTESEVATLTYVRLFTTIPVPRVVAYDNTTDNALRAEWILMERIPGKPYSEVQRQMTAGQKIEMARKVADWRLQLDGMSFSQRGSLYWKRPAHGGVEAEERSTVASDEFYVGPCIPRVVNQIDGSWPDLDDFIRLSKLHAAVFPLTKHFYLRPHLDTSHLMIFCDETAHSRSYRISGMIGLSRTSTEVLDLIPALPDFLMDVKYMPEVPFLNSWNEAILGPKSEARQLLEQAHEVTLMLWAYHKRYERRVRTTRNDDQVKDNELEEGEIPE